MAPVTKPSEKPRNVEAKEMSCLSRMLTVSRREKKIEVEILNAANSRIKTQGRSREGD